MRVALALGSGGARGYAHIGAIRELEARGHQIVAISGSSIGAVVGGMYAAGKLDEFEEWVRSLNQRNVLWMVDPSMSGGGAIRARRLTAKISQLLDGKRIEDLPIPYTAVSTDLQARREVWFTRGPLDVAMRASFAIPSVITPAMVGERIMIDGGVLNPVPMEPLLSANADLVVAVSLTGRNRGYSAGVQTGSSDSRDSRSWRRARNFDTKLQGKAGKQAKKKDGSALERRKTQISELLDQDMMAAVANRLLPVIDETDLGRTSAGSKVRQVLANRAATEDPAGPAAAGTPVENGDEQLAAVAAAAAAHPDDHAELDNYEMSEDLESAINDEPDDETFGTLPKSLGLFDVVVQALDAVEATITGYRMAGNPPDVLIDIPADLASAFDFHRAEEVIAYGRQLAIKELDRYGA